MEQSGMDRGILLAVSCDAGGGACDPIGWQYSDASGAVAGLSSIQEACGAVGPGRDSCPRCENSFQVTIRGFFMLLLALDSMKCLASTFSAV